jgi:Arc/MetJ family transcription regulator
MISKILVSVLTELGARIFAYILAQRAKEQKTAIADQAVDSKVTAVQSALRETLDGLPATKEQKAKANEAFRDLVRSSGSR